MTKLKLAGTRIVTGDVSRLAQFYEAVLDHLPIGSDEYLEFRVSGIVLAICSQCAFDICARSTAVPGDNRSVVLDFEVADVDAERRRLDSIVDRFVLEPVTQPWGSRSMLFRDPDGNLINFFTSSHDIRSQ
jgi:predicted enzyme related to lactoylglutathione lyase